MNSKNLSPLACQVLYENATEPPFENKYWNHFDFGLYLDPTNNEVLFSCYDKFFSFCGWPSFVKPFSKDAVVYENDLTHNMIRIEVRTKKSNLHLGHVFDDLAPQYLDKGFRRYCINSEALSFISAKEIQLSNDQKLKDIWNKHVWQNIPKLGVITLAGGCFWGVDQLMKQIFGIYSSKVGYANYQTKTPPTYKQVCSETTNAVEAVELYYNKELVSLNAILDIFFANIDPLSVNQQGNDKGSQYRTGVYYHTQQDKIELEKYWQDFLVPRFGNQIKTELLPLKNFALAEEEHQDYLIKNPNGYCHIKFNGFK